MASRAALNRLQKEYARIVKEPSPDIEAHPRESNILEWHFVIKGPKDTPYTGGSYHGKLIFPSEYPYKPPAIMMLTPKCVRAPHVANCPTGAHAARGTDAQRTRRVSRAVAALSLIHI